MVRVRGIDLVEQCLKIALHDRERSSQLMRDVRQELLPLLFAALETRGHRVERAGKRTELARSTWQHANGVVPRLDLLSGVDQVAERDHDPADRTCDGGRDDEERKDRDERRESAEPRARGGERGDEQRDEGRHHEGEEQEGQEREDGEPALEVTAHARPVAARWGEWLVLR